MKQMVYITSQSFSIMITDKTIQLSIGTAEAVIFVPILVLIPYIFIDLDQ